MRKIPEALGEEIAAAYEAGATLRALATVAGIHHDTVRRYLVDQGVAIRDHRQRVQEVLETDGAGLIAAYEGGATVAALAADAGVSSSTIAAYLVAHGVAIRDSHWQPREALENHCVELTAAYEAGTPLSVLAGRVGVSPRTLRKFLAAQGVRLRHDRGWYRRQRHAGG
jgi:lambda repressor-like predicted transcriptional regulator